MLAIMKKNVFNNFTEKINFFSFGELSARLFRFIRAGVASHKFNIFILITFRKVNKHGKILKYVHRVSNAILVIFYCRST